MGDPRDGWGGWNDYRTLTIKDAFLLYQEDREVLGYLLTLFSPYPRRVPYGFVREQQREERPREKRGREMLDRLMNAVLSLGYLAMIGGIYCIAMAWTRSL